MLKSLRGPYDWFNHLIQFKLSQPEGMLGGFGTDYSRDIDLDGSKWSDWSKFLILEELLSNAC